MRDCQQSQTLDILILLYIPYLSTAANHKYKTAIKQHKVIGTNWAHKRSRRVPEIFAATAALKHQAASPQAPRRLQDLGLPKRQEIDTALACSIPSHQPAMHFSLFTSCRFS